MTPVDQSIEAAYTAHAAGLSRRLAVMTRDPAAAEDLTHEAFVRLATEMHAGRAPDNVPAWLHRVGSNLVASSGRHASVADRHLASLPRPEVAPSPEAASISAEEARLVRSALGTLGRADRHALVLAAQGYGGPESPPASAGQRARHGRCCVVHGRRCGSVSRRRESIAEGLRGGPARPAPAHS